MHICKGAQLKIEWANKHIAELGSSIDRLKKRLSCAAHVDLSSGCEFIKCDFVSIDDTQILNGLSTIIGDAVHNLRCALDHVWQEAMARIVPARDWGKTKFPSFPTSQKLELELKKLHIDVSSPQFFRFLMEEIKPYCRGNSAIWPVLTLDIRDKHLLLIPVIHYASINNIYLEDQNGELHRAGTWGTVMPFPHYLKLERGIRIKNPGSLNFDLMFEDWDGRESRVPDALRFYSERILTVVETLQAFV